MPELPEVEVVRRGLAEYVTGRRIESVEIRGARVARRHVPGPADLAARVEGADVVAVCRRGKYLWLPLDDTDALLGHLGMSGQMLVQPADAEPEKHLRVRLRLEGAAEGRHLHFVDQRMFGGLSVSPGGADLPPEIAHIARDPMDPLFDDAVFVAAVRRRSSGIKRILLDQGTISGVGNIYADEALWRARVHSETPASALPPVAGAASKPVVRTVTTFTASALCTVAMALPA